VKVQILSAKYQEKKTQLESNDTYLHLKLLEQKLNQHESVTFTLKDYISSKTNESDYSIIAKEVQSLTTTINTQLIKINCLPHR
jgi:intraflagellar transport protein 74